MAIVRCVALIYEQWHVNKFYKTAEFRYNSASYNFHLNGNLFYHYLKKNN